MHLGVQRAVCRLGLGRHRLSEHPERLATASGGEGGRWREPSQSAPRGRWNGSAPARAECLRGILTRNFPPDLLPLEADDARSDWDGAGERGRPAAHARPRAPDLTSTLSGRDSSHSSRGVFCSAASPPRSGPRSSSMLPLAGRGRSLSLHRAPEEAASLSRSLEKQPRFTFPRRPPHKLRRTPPTSRSVWRRHAAHAQWAGSPPFLRARARARAGRRRERTREARALGKWAWVACRFEDGAAPVAWDALMKLP